MSSAYASHSRAGSLSWQGNAVAMQASKKRLPPAGWMSPGHHAAAGLERTQVLAKLESAAAIRNADAILEEVAGLQVRGSRRCNRPWQQTEPSGHRCGTCWMPFLPQADMS